MRWLWTFIRSWFGAPPRSKDRSHLMGMYLDESNARGRRKPNRERA